jgi:hypothetical protein
VPRDRPRHPDDGDIAFVDPDRVDPPPGNATTMNDGTLLLLVSPLIIIQFGLIIFALHDLIQPDRKVKGDSKLMWGVIICLISLIGPILYLTVGREER